MDKEFEAEEVKVFGAMYRKGYIYKGLKPVYWCPKDETALAEAEIEYADDKCTSIYVKFAVKDDQGKLAPYGGTDNTYVIIWTTTPWTLPGNLAIAFNPVEEYVLLDAGKERYIVARALAEKTMKEGGVESYTEVASFQGSFFEYMTAQHPFLDRASLMVTADYVTMEGTLFFLKKASQSLQFVKNACHILLPLPRYPRKFVENPQRQWPVSFSCSGAY